MKKSLLLVIILIAFVFISCTAQSDDLISLKTELADVNKKVAQLEKENIILKNEIVEIESELEQRLATTDEPESTKKFAQTLASISTPTLTPTPTPKPTSTPTSTPLIRPIPVKNHPLSNTFGGFVYVLIYTIGAVAEMNRKLVF